MKKIEKINLGLGIVSIFGVIISIFISVWAIKSNEDIAKKSGAFDKGELRLSFGGYFIYPDLDFDVYYGIDFTDTTILHFGTLPISIHNLGNKTIDNVNMIVKYPHIGNIAVNDFIKLEFSSIEPIERKFSTIEPYDQVAFKLNSLNPNFSISTGELICLREETILRDTFPVTTKDNKSFNLSANIHYSYPIVIGLTAKDEITAQYHFILNYRKETNLEKLISNIIDEKISQKDNSKVRKNFFVIIPKLMEITGKGNQKLAIMDSNSSNTLLCEFDNTMMKVAVMNQNGSIQKQISVIENKK